jgi:hypothetical protein
MAIVLNYDFDKTHIKNSSYSPVAYGNIEDEQVAIRKGLVEILYGTRVIPIHITNCPKEN